jgi:predicted metal-binding membrane protein
VSRTCLILVFVAVGRKQRDVAPHLLIRRIHVAGYLGARRVFKLLITVDVDQRALLLALVAVEDAQRNTDAEPSALLPFGLLLDSL